MKKKYLYVLSTRKFFKKYLLIFRKIYQKNAEKLAMDE